MNTPKLSVLMPAYNAEKYIAEAIESILNQTFADFEFIIVDDGSTDGTWGIIQRYAEREGRIVGVRNEENMRISGTLNRGISLARGEFIARMDADDWSYPDRFQKQIQYMEEHPNVVISGGSMEICSGNLTVLNERKYHLRDRDIRTHLFRYSPFCHATTIYRKEQVQKIGGYNVDLADAEDYDLYFRMGKIGDFGNIPDVLFKVRTHEESMSRVKARRQELLTLYIRLKAIMEYGYDMKLADKLYFFGQLISMYLMPSSLKFWVFNFLRSI